MDDIVERLRSCLNTVDPTCTPLSSVPRAYAVEAADTIDRQRKEIGRLKRAVQDIARQKTMVELEDELDGCDFDYAYDKMIEVARAALEDGT